MHEQLCRVLVRQALQLEAPLLASIHVTARWSRSTPHGPPPAPIKTGAPQGFSRAGEVPFAPPAGVAAGAKLIVVAPRRTATAEAVSILEDAVSSRTWWAEQWPEGVQYVAGLVAQDVQDALPEIERVLESGQVPRHAGAFFALRADRIACLTRIGAIDSAQQFAGEFKEVNLEALSPDDRALCLASLEALASISESSRTTSDISIQVQDALADLGTLRRKLHASLLKYA